MTELNEQQPWANHDHGWSDEVIEMQAESMDTDVAELADSLRKDAWLKDQALETVLEHECPDVVGRVDHDTRLDHNVHVYTTFTDFPSEMVQNSGFDEWLDWFIDLRGAIDRYTEYRITNKREIDGQLVLTLAPE
jgi:hypothetical protein